MNREDSAGQQSVGDMEYYDEDHIEEYEVVAKARELKEAVDGLTVGIEWRSLPEHPMVVGMILSQLRGLLRAVSRLDRGVVE